MNADKMLAQVKYGAQFLRQLSAEKKNAVLTDVTELLKSESVRLLSENQKDLKSLKPSASAAFRDRLILNEERISQMQESLRQVVRLEDPIGEIVEERRLPNGLLLKRVRAPLGVIFMIFESRPNVAIEAFSLAFKAGNAVILRGGKESARTTAVLYGFIEQALKAQGVEARCLWGISNPDRKIPNYLLKQNTMIDVVVPRGGEGLIDFVVKNSRIPIIKNDRGLCHIYVHEDAAIEMAARIVENAKTQRPGVCNSMETLLVHESIAQALLPYLYDKLRVHKLEWRVCPQSWKILKGRDQVKKAKVQDWDTEYLDMFMNCRVVNTIDQALDHISLHGSRHSESIVTSNSEAAKRFQKDVDAAAVYWNASTRFTDGFEFGLGGELGISTQKLHVRGPVGLRELTSLRWIIDGNGQIRV